MAIEKTVNKIRLSEQPGDLAWWLSKTPQQRLAAYAQEAIVTSFPRAVGIAVQSFDAWFIADHSALSTVLRAKVDMQPAPETVSDPKKRCQMLNETANSGQPLRAVYSMISAIMNFEILRQRCPIGFAVFAQRVERLKEAISNKS